MYEQEDTFFSLDTNSNYDIDYYFYEGVGMGQTRVDFCFNFGGIEVLQKSFDIYVNVRPTLMAISSPRHSCNYCGQTY